ncbi:MAG: hypothetical protein P0121_06995 [Nitrospira sp.]|nr:hypothetical protein [Nitrospira sp.]
MLHRWLGTVLLAWEGQFRSVKGYAAVAPVTVRIETEQVEQQPALTKNAAQPSPWSSSETFNGDLDNSHCLARTALRLDLVLLAPPAI